MSSDRLAISPRLSLVGLDRKQIAKAFGSIPDCLHCFEVCGSFVLRSTAWGGLTPKARLSPSTVEGLASALPRIELHHGSHQLRDRQSLRIPSLWEELFPYPLSVIAGLYQPLTADSVRVEPPLLKYSLEKLWDSLQSLERRLSQQELSCLWIRRRGADGGIDLPIFFQYVRRKRVRAGLAANQPAWLDFLRASERTASLAPSDHGLSIAVFPLLLETRATWEEQLTHIAESMRNSPGAALEAPRRVPLDTTGPALGL